MHANTMPCADPTIYKVIKREMDSTMGIVSQVIVAGKASGLGRSGEQTSHSNMLQYVANVGLKVNHKLGGANMRIRSLGDSVEQAPPIWSSKPTMLIGMDVSHPQSFDTSEPSIVGIVASMDKCAPSFCCLPPYVLRAVHIQQLVAAPRVILIPVASAVVFTREGDSEERVYRNLAQYACRIKRTGHRKEIVDDIHEDIKSLLQLFKQRNGVKPESIVVYRDGVSQGEFKEVCFPCCHPCRHGCTPPPAPACPLRAQ